MPPGALPDADRAAVRALLPLPLVPARNRNGVRVERADRVRPRRAAARYAGDSGHAVEQRSRAEDRPLSRVPRRAVEPLCGGGACATLRPRRHAGRSGPPATRYPHLHGVEAAVGRAAAGYPRRPRVLRQQALLARREPRAAPRLTGHAAAMNAVIL